jgi:hypothetical protein
MWYWNWLHAMSVAPLMRYDMVLASGKRLGAPKHYNWHTRVLPENELSSSKFQTKSSQNLQLLLFMQTEQHIRVVTHWARTFLCTCEISMWFNVTCLVYYVAAPEIHVLDGNVGQRCWHAGRFVSEFALHALCINNLFPHCWIKQGPTGSMGWVNEWYTGKDRMDLAVACTKLARENPQYLHEDTWYPDTN